MSGRSEKNFAPDSDQVFVFHFNIADGGIRQIIISEYSHRETPQEEVKSRSVGLTEVILESFSAKFLKRTLNPRRLYV